MTRRGFTLVEVLVALAVMAIIAALAWRGVDGMLRAREVTQSRFDRTTRLHTVLTQWEQDLGAVVASGSVPAIAFDGQTLRLTRAAGANGSAGVMLVAWALRDGRWMRWTGEPTTRQGALQEQWLASQQLLGNEPRQLVLIDGVDEWQVYYYRGGRLTNAQSSADLEQAPSPAPPASGASAPAPVLREVLPEGVQLVLRLGGATLTRDIALVPRS